MSNQHPTTTDAGCPVASDEYSLTVAASGPVLLQDVYLIEKLAHFVRERVPDRVYHVKGGGAFGYFEVTADVTEWTKAAFLNEVGKRTPMLVRFSSVAGEEGYPDSDRDVRGFAMKFYTEEGNYDLVGNNTPVFFVRDPMKFPDFIHSQERMPDSGLRSNNMQWDFWSLSPESVHQVTVLMSDRGTPRDWRHMNGYSSDTYMWENAAGKKFWVKYHFKTEQGIQSFTDAEAKAMRAEDLDCHRRDLWDAIARKDYPSWRLEMQIMPYEDAANYRFNPFDVTKVWSHKDYPPITVGRFVRPQPRELLRPDRAGRVRRGELRPGHRAQPGSDGAGADVRLRRLEPLSQRPELCAAAGQPPTRRGAQLQQGRPDALPPQREPAVLRAQQLRRPQGRSAALPRSELVCGGRRDHAHGLRRAPGRQRLHPARRALPAGDDADRSGPSSPKFPLVGRA
jgi:hypothetical protein